MLYAAILFASILLVAIVAVPVLVFAAECLSGSLPSRSVPTAQIAIRPCVAVLVPAHNESAGLAESLRNIRGEMRHGDRLIVVADNCTDNTAEIARGEGAEVVERHDLAQRGKGYALDAGVQYLRQAPAKIVIVIDADCRIGPGTLDHLATAVVARKRPAQALNLQIAPPNSALNLAVAEFAFLVKNRVRPLGLSRLGLPCLMTGTGMALPWSLLDDASLASGHQVEDMKFALNLAQLGHAPCFCEEALVTSFFPHSREGAETQRRRWEGGHLSMICFAIRDLLRPSSWANLGYLALLFDILVPPLTLLCVATFFMVVFAGVAALAIGAALPLTLALLVAMLLVGAAAIAWAAHGRTVLPLRSLAQVPLYAASKARLYPKLASASDAWVRTDRTGPDRAS